MQALMVYISEQKLMESVLYRSIFEKGEARGRSEARVEVLASMLIRLLAHRHGVFDPGLHQRIRACSDADMLDALCNEAMIADAEGSRRLVEKLQHVLPA